MALKNQNSLFDEPELKTIHECLQDAAFDDILVQSRYEGTPVDERDFVVTSFRLDISLRSRVDEICKLNGASFGAFLRQCCRQLISDYDEINIGSKKWNTLYGKNKQDDALWE